MKILQINIFYNEGSTGKIVGDIHSRLLRDGHDSYVVFGRGKAWEKDDPDHLFRTTPGNRSLFYRKLSRITGLRYNTAYFETKKLLRHIDRMNPDVVHLHCMNCAYIEPFVLLRHLGKRGCRVLVTHHADVTITANCDHAFDCEKWENGCGHCATNRSERRSFFIDATHRSWVQMRDAFSKVSRLYASGVSEWMSSRVRRSPFFASAECRTILNGLDTESFTYRTSSACLREKLGIGEYDKVVAHVTPDFSAAIKGGRYVVELARRMPDVRFVIIGIKPCEIRNLPANVIPVERIASKHELSEYYSMADVTLLTSYRESFSMVTAESLCCGTPVVGFKAGAPETITIPEFSKFVGYGDIDALQNAVAATIEGRFDRVAVSEIAKLKYDAEKMYSEYLAYYKDIIGC